MGTPPFNALTNYDLTDDHIWPPAYFFISTAYGSKQLVSDVPRRARPPAQPARIAEWDKPCCTAY